MDDEKIVGLVRDTLIVAGTTFKDDKKNAYKRAIHVETSENAKWVMQTILENAEVAEKNSSPLCDDSAKLVPSAAILKIIFTTFAASGSTSSLPSFPFL